MVDTQVGSHYFLIHTQLIPPFFPSINLQVATTDKTNKTNKTNTSYTDFIDLVSCPDVPPRHVIRQTYKSHAADSPFSSKLASIIAKKEVAKIKIKLEPGYRADTTTSVTQAAYASNDDAAHDHTVRNELEQGKVLLLQQMGFTDLREMLDGLRHIEQSSGNLSTMDAHAHVNMAMLWIVVSLCCTMQFTLGLIRHTYYIPSTIHTFISQTIQ